VDEVERLTEPEFFDHLHLLTESYGQVRRYAPALLETLDFGAAPAVAPLLAVIDTLRTLSAWAAGCGRASGSDAIDS
jgi:hypothetical protein